MELEIIPHLICHGNKISQHQLVSSSCQENVCLSFNIIEGQKREKLKSKQLSFFFSLISKQEQKPQQLWHWRTNAASCIHFHDLHFTPHKPFLDNMSFFPPFIYFISREEKVDLSNCGSRKDVERRYEASLHPTNVETKWSVISLNGSARKTAALWCTVLYFIWESFLILSVE